MTQCLLCRSAIILLVAGFAQGSPHSQSPPTRPTVGSVERTWNDLNRNRTVPVRIYYPDNGAGPYPVIVFSHGLGGTRRGYGYLGRHWAAAGYVSVHLQHIGSDDSSWRGKKDLLGSLRQAAREPMNALNRPLDVRFAIGELERANLEPGPLKGLLDLERLGIAGHSFGAFTAMAVAGQVFTGPIGNKVKLSDSRFRAAVVMSPTIPRNRKQLERSYSEIEIPCLFMTGTLDSSPVTPTVKAQDRRIPFDYSADLADRYLITFKGGDHQVFSGRRLGKRSDDARFHDLIQRSTTAFWDAYLKGDEKALRWMRGSGIVSALAADGALEMKRASRP